MDTIQWGIIGCGDVTEVKSGPAFNKVPYSKLVAVMRRDEEKVKDYARRHGVPKWYTSAEDLIGDKDVNAVYIATPPAYHAEYALAAIKAGKMVYIEKPVTTNTASAQAILAAALQRGVKVSVAHYRRAQPLFQKVKELIQNNEIGDIRLAELTYFRSPLSKEELENPRIQWRVTPHISGGGLFHDLAPHQLDLLIYFFGGWAVASGHSLNTGCQYKADDTVTGYIRFGNNILVSGTWCFATPPEAATDLLHIIGSKGSIRLSVFGAPAFSLTKDGHTTTFSFPPLPHVQQPMIEKVVQYFLNKAPNPCPLAAGVEVMQLMERFTLLSASPS